MEFLCITAAKILTSKELGFKILQTKGLRMALSPALEQGGAGVLAARFAPEMIVRQEGEITRKVASFFLRVCFLRNCLSDFGGAPAE
jgi:hypothetical protein